MFTTVRRYQLQPGTMEEVIRRVKQEFVPLLSKTPGFRAYDVVKADEGVLASITTFDDKRGAEESNRLAADWVKKNLAQQLPNPPEITAGEVTIHTVH